MRNLIGVNPIRFLVFAAVFNGIAADRAMMGAARSGWLSRAVLQLTFIGMAARRPQLPLRRLLEILGPGLVTRGGRRRPVRDHDLLPDQRPVRLRPALDG